MGKDKDKKKKDKSKLTDSDLMSLQASSFNAGAALVAASLSKGKLEGVVESVLDLSADLYEARIIYLDAEGLGSPKGSGGGGRGGSGGYSGGSKKSSGGSSSSGASPKQAGFYGDLIDSIEEEGGDAAYSIKQFKKLSGSDASDAIETAIELRDELQN